MKLVFLRTTNGVVLILALALIPFSAFADGRIEGLVEGSGQAIARTAANAFRKHEYEEALTETLKIEMPNFFWTQIFLAAAYGQLGRKEEGRKSVARLLKLYPGIAANVRQEMHKFNYSADLIKDFVQGLRKAGLDVPSAQG